MSAVRIAGIALGAAFLLAMSWVSTAPMSVATTDSAMVRISFGARPERVEECRTVSDEELAKLAPQMRQRVICEGTTARYQLELRRGEELLLSQLVRGGGLRNDRPLYVSRDLPVASGTATYRVTLVRLDTIRTPDTVAAKSAVPPALSLETSANLAPREVLLFTYDATGRRLVSRRTSALPGTPGS
jgi:hypothetical protein